MYSTILTREVRSLPEIARNDETLNSLGVLLNGQKISSIRLKFALSFALKSDPFYTSTHGRTRILVLRAARKAHERFTVGQKILEYFTGSRERANGNRHAE